MTPSAAACHSGGSTNDQLTACAIIAPMPRTLVQKVLLSQNFLLSVPVKSVLVMAFSFRAASLDQKKAAGRSDRRASHRLF